MPRKPRIHSAGLFFHVLNRANSKLNFFIQKIDYEEFTGILIESLNKFKIEIYAYILMPTHWHIVCSAKIDGEISRWMAWVQMMHTFKWHKRNNSKGKGHFYQGRYKSFIIQDNVYFLQVCRYVERNALRAGLVVKAEYWKWSSIYQKNKIPINNWPIEKPNEYIRFVNESVLSSELESIRTSIIREKPFGDINWVQEVAIKNNIKQTLRPIGRPNKKGNKGQ